MRIQKIGTTGDGKSALDMHDGKSRNKKFGNAKGKNTIIVLTML